MIGEVEDKEESLAIVRSKPRRARGEEFAIEDGWTAFELSIDIASLLDSDEFSGARPELVTVPDPPLAIDLGLAHPVGRGGELLVETIEGFPTPDRLDRPEGKGVTHRASTAGACQCTRLGLQDEE